MLSFARGEFLTIKRCGDFKIFARQCKQASRLSYKYESPPVREGFPVSVAVNSAERLLCVFRVVFQKRRQRKPPGNQVGLNSGFTRIGICS